MYRCTCDVVVCLICCELFRMVCLCSMSSVLSRPVVDSMSVLSGVSPLS